MNVFNNLSEYCICLFFGAFLLILPIVNAISINFTAFFSLFAFQESFLTYTHSANLISYQLIFSIRGLLGII